MEHEELIEVSLVTDDNTITTKLRASEIEEISADANKYLALLQKLEQEKAEADTLDTNKENTLSYNNEPKQSVSVFRWTTESTKPLLDLRLGMEDKFNNPTCKKIKLWEQISKQMQEVGKCSISANECNAKYRNLLQTYRHNKEKRLKTTGESKIMWEFFEVFDLVLGSKASTTPPASILSSNLSSTLSVKATKNEDIPSDDSVPGNSKKKVEKKKVNEISVGQYLYYKKDKDEQKWKERKELKEKEIEAINNLAAAIKATAGCSALHKTKNKVLKRKFYESDSD